MSRSIMHTLLAPFVRRCGAMTKVCMILLRDQRSGAATFEFAVIGLALAYIFMGMIDTGLMMLASQEVEWTAAAAVRQVRTGAVQEAASVASANTGNANWSSTFAGAANCASPTYTLTGTQNCIGITYSSSDTASTIFSKLLCANTLGSTVIDCKKYNYNVSSYSSFADFSGAVPGLTYNPDGSPAVTFSGGSASQVIVAMVGYKYHFFTPLLGCLFDVTDCSSGNTSIVLTYFAVFQAEPWGNSSIVG